MSGDYGFLLFLASGVVAVVFLVWSFWEMMA